MPEENDDFKNDELIEVKLSRDQYQVLKEMIKRDQAYDWLTKKLKSNWLFVVGGGALTLWALYDKFQTALFGTVK